MADFSQLFKFSFPKNCRRLEDGAGTSHSTRSFGTENHRLSKSASNVLNVETLGIRRGKLLLVTLIGHLSDAVGTGNKQGVAAIGDDVRNRLAIRDSLARASAGFDEVEPANGAVYMSVLSPYYSVSAVSRDGIECDERLNRGEVNSGLEERLFIFPERKGLGRTLNGRISATSFRTLEVLSRQRIPMWSRAMMARRAERQKTEKKVTLAKTQREQKEQDQKGCTNRPYSRPDDASTDDGVKRGCKQMLTSTTSARCTSGAECEGLSKGNGLGNKMCCNLI